MDFILNEEQTLLRDMAARFAADARARQEKTPEAPDRRWSRFAELGLLGLTLSEAHGGLGGGGVETMIVAEEMGRQLLTDPFVPTVAVAGPLIAALGEAAQQAQLLPALAAGDLVVVPAFLEPEARYDLAQVATTARAEGERVVISGRKAVVLNAPEADLLLVSARTSGAHGDPEGLCLYLVPTGAPGVVLRAITTLDGRPAAEVTLNAVTVEAAARLGPAGAALPAMEQAVDRGVAALTGEAVGAMAALFDLTAEYLRTRKQFGAPIGKFQALQHKLVDMKVALELARSVAAAAAMAVDVADAEVRRRFIAAAKVQVARSGRFIGQAAIQLHGAMGMTDEYGAGRYLKRLVVIGALHGDLAHHLERFAASTEPAGPRH
ncbi:acyl-CoA dehydrogenase family protein [Xanthobacter agilis]|uniref:acyl-CoA dehydrogenase family protein n=1 Tax=Xanthobacter agilis TaxID=47492 RepID=UPI0037299510